METYILQRTALPDLTFSGRLLVQSIGEDPDNETLGRVHDIAVYETDDGEYIVAVRHRAGSGCESDNFVEAVGSIDDAEAVLSLYDATERFDEIQFEDVPRRKHASAVMISRFDRQVLKVLEALRTTEVV